MTLLPKRRRVSDPAYLARVRELQCVICQRTPCEAHHPIHGRYSQRKASDTDAIPLCADHHRELHHSPTAWKRQHGLDTDYLPRVAEMLRQIEERTV